MMQSIEKHFSDARDYVEQATEDIKEAQILKKENRKVCSIS